MVTKTACKTPLSLGFFATWSLGHVVYHIPISRQTVDDQTRARYSALGMLANGFTTGDVTLYCPREPSEAMLNDLKHGDLMDNKKVGRIQIWGTCSGIVDFPVH